MPIVIQNEKITLLNEYIFLNFEIELFTIILVYKEIWFIVFLKRTL